MKTNHVVRAWKDQEYRQSLSAAERASLPVHPSGMIEVNDIDLGAVSGGAATAKNCPTKPICATQICTVAKPTCNGIICR